MRSTCISWIVAQVWWDGAGPRSRSDFEKSDEGVSSNPNIHWCSHEDNIPREMLCQCDGIHIDGEVLGWRNSATSRRPVEEGLQWIGLISVLRASLVKVVVNGAPPVDPRISRVSLKSRPAVFDATAAGFGTWTGIVFPLSVHEYADFYLSLDCCSGMCIFNFFL